MMWHMLYSIYMLYVLLARNNFQSYTFTEIEYVKIILGLC